MIDFENAFHYLIRSYVFIIYTSIYIHINSTFRLTFLFNVVMKVFFIIHILSSNLNCKEILQHFYFLNTLITLIIDFK